MSSGRLAAISIRENAVNPITTPVYHTVILGSAGAYTSPLTIDAGGEVAPTNAGAIGVFSDTSGVMLTIDAAGRGSAAGEIKGGAGALGLVGGTAVNLSATASLYNHGLIRGGYGYNGGLQNGSGGDGVDMAGTLKNYSSINGGSGYVGGSGGVGVDLSSGTVANGTSSSTGVAGIRGGSAQSGTGGIGLIMTGTGKNYGAIVGGLSNSGTGGVGVELQGTGTSLTNDDVIGGGQSTTGAGGVGVAMGVGTTLDNFVSVTGGSGGISATAGTGIGVGVTMAAGAMLNTYNGSTISGTSIASGSGGDGVDMLGKATITSTGDEDTIKGGYTGQGTGGDGIFMSAGGSISIQYAEVEGGSASSSNAVTGGVGVYAKGTATASATISVGHYASFYGEGRIDGGASNNGNGGVGVQLAADASLTNEGRVRGGSAYDNTGGTGLVVNGSTAYNVNFGTGLIIGGYESGKTGTAGIGVDLASPGARFTNLNYVSGGNDAYVGHFHGTAGLGVEVDIGAVFTNYGHVVGGGISNGGTGNVGMYLNGGKAINAGYINGTEYYDATTHANAFFDSLNFGPTTGSSLVLESHFGTYGTLNGEIEGFKIGDTIQVNNAALTSAANLSGSPGSFQISTPHDGTLDFSGTYTGEHFTFTASGGNTIIGLAEGAACFCRGTRIRTPRGEVPIEMLHVGDAVTTLSGEARTIRWIGKRRYSATAAAGNVEVLPVRLRAGALGEGLPLRDLWVSPEHAMFIDGMLIPAQALINGASIIQEQSAAEVVYLHVEFDTHDVIFAEGAPSESFVDDDSRQQFDNAWDFARLYPHLTPQPARMCAPRVEEGTDLEALRRRYAELARHDARRMSA